VGMILILTGLYSFLWGKGKETETMAEASIQVSISTQSVGVHSTAMVVPNISPSNAILGDDEKTNTN